MVRDRPGRTVKARPRPLSLRATCGLFGFAMLAFITFAGCTTGRVGQGRGHFDSSPNVASSTDATLDMKRSLARVAFDQLDPASAHERPLSFVSAESTLGSHMRIENRIRAASSERFDVWLMRQRHGDTDTSDPLTWSFVAIVVNKFVPAGERFRAHYFEFERAAVTKGSEPARAPMTAPCQGCHASGPRVIRPTRESLDAMSAAERDMLAVYNQTIRRYGNVENVAVEGGMPRVAAVTGSAELSLARCTGCHYAGSRVRAPLFPWHAGTIEFMVADHENVRPMPPTGAALSTGDLTYLERWCDPSGTIGKK